MDMQPSTVNLRFTRVESRFYPVRVRLAEPLPAGWMVVDSLAAQPARIRVTGPEARLAEIDSLFTVPLILPREDTAFTLSVPIDTANLQGLRLSARRIELTGRVDAIAERTFTGIRISVGPGVVLNPSTVDVRLRGPRHIVQAMSADDLRIVISIDSIPARIPEGGIPVPLRVERLRAGVQAELSPAATRMMPGRLVADTIGVPRIAEPGDTIPPPD
jgi:YbbR domain-containing protein